MSVIDDPLDNGALDNFITAREVTAARVPTGGLDEWDAGQDDSPIPPRGWLLGNLFARRFMSSLLADGGVGKTAMRVAQLLSSATGRPLLGDHVFQRCRVLIVSLEDDVHELRRRVRAACLHHTIDLADLTGWLFLSAPGGSKGKLVTLDESGRPVTGELARRLEATIIKRRPDIVSLDPFVKSHAVEENSNSAIDGVVQVLTDLAAKYDIAVDAPHHTSKGQGDPGNANRGRGASSMKDAGRLVYTLTQMSPEEAQAFGVKEEQRRVLIRMDSAKVNIAPPMRSARWFRLVGVPLGNETPQYPRGDEVQTVETWTPPDLWAGLTSAGLNEILTTIDMGLSDGARYTDTPSAKDRAAWRLVVEHSPGKTEQQAREIIRAWVKSGLLVAVEYEDQRQRKALRGLRVDNSKRPT